MTPDDLAAILAQLQDVVARIAKAHENVDGVANPQLTAGVIIAAHGIALAADGATAIATALGCDEKAALALREAHHVVCHRSGIVGDDRALRGALGWILERAQALAHTRPLPEEPKGVQ
mgnify:CR=1 FL=1